MQSNTASAMLAFILLLACCCCSAASRTSLRRIQPSGDADIDQRDALAIRQVEGLDRKHAKDGAALMAAAQKEEERAQAEESDGSQAEQDASAIKKAAMLEYTRHLIRAKKELLGSPRDETVAERAAVLQEHAEVEDALSLQDLGDRLKLDAAAVRMKAADAINDFNAIAKATNLTVAREEGDAKVLEDAAKDEQMHASSTSTASISAARVSSAPLNEEATQSKRRHAANTSAALAKKSRRASAQEEMADVNQLRSAALAEQQAAKKEWTASDDESRDADALKHAAMLGYLSRIQRAQREFSNQPERERAEEAAAEQKERQELADAYAVAQAAGALRRDAEATSKDAQEVGADATAIEAVGHMSKLGHK